MGCCMGKKVLKMLAGLLLILVVYNVVGFNAWLVVGAYLFLSGLMPFVCQCQGCGNCGVDMKKKK